MIPELLTIPDKKLIGLHLTLSLANYNIGELWRRFMPRRREILHPSSTDLISLAVYPDGYFDHFNPATEFDRWATVEVSSFDEVPAGLETLVLPGGLYAVFHYQGANTDNAVFQYIYGVWLPASEYVLDDRPHFEVLGANYKNNDPASEEEIWIPVKTK